MFDDESIRSMGIDPDRCRAKANLFRAMAESERERGLFLAESPSDARLDDATVSQELSGTMHEAQIGLLFQTSAECSMLLRESDGRDALALSAKAYLSTGTPYGLMLSTLFPRSGGKHRSREDFWEGTFLEFTRASKGEREKREEHSEYDDMRVAAMQRPEQLTWLFLGAANSTGGASLLREAWESHSKVMDSHGHLPVGPLGIPVSAHFHLFNAILREEQRSAALNEVFAIALARRSEALSLARRNEYLWVRVRSPVAFFDFHLFALASSAAKHGLINQNTLGAMMSTLDEQNPLMKLATAPMILAFDGRADSGPQRT